MDSKSNNAIRKVLQTELKPSTKQLQPQPRREVEVSKYGEKVYCKSISLYDDEVLTPEQAAIEVTKIGELFNMQNDAKLVIMAEIMLEDGWTLQRVKDAVKHVLKTNIYNTSEKGIEPGVILSFDKRIKLYTQADVMTLNNGTGTHGYRLVKMPGMTRRTMDGVITEFWYVREDELDLLP